MHILVVDDEKLLRMTTEELLRSLGYTVSTAEDGETALLLLADDSNPIDVVILDMIMPKMSGRDCFYIIRDKYPNIKVILVSGFTQDKEVLQLKEEGIAAFLFKPYHTSDLREAISLALGETPYN